MNGIFSVRPFRGAMHGAWCRVSGVPGRVSLHTINRLAREGRIVLLRERPGVRVYSRAKP